MKNVTPLELQEKKLALIKEHFHQKAVGLDHLYKVDDVKILLKLFLALHIKMLLLSCFRAVVLHLTLIDAEAADESLEPVAQIILKDSLVNDQVIDHKQLLPCRDRFQQCFLHILDFLNKLARLFALCLACFHCLL